MALNIVNFEKELGFLCKNITEKKFLLAVSGGVDSMVLAWLFRNSFIINNFSITHINYNLRGEDSVADRRLVQNFCDKNHIPLFLYEVSTKDNKPKQGSIQLWARELRYQFFHETMNREDIDYLVTAHHLDDQLETFLINLSRGTGIAGLCGIPKNENKILRPLLNISKSEIYNFAKEHNIDFREDKSNQKNDYLRNKIRNQISPILKEINPDFLRNFQKSISILEQSKNFIKEKTDQLFKEISSTENGTIIINKNQLNTESSFTKFEILKRFGFENDNEINKIFLAQSGSIFQSKESSLIIHRNQLIINKKNTNQNKNKDEITFSEEDCIIKNKNHKELKINTEKSFSWSFDADKVKFPLTLRHQQDGDSFSPIGMHGKKKVSKYFKDMNFSPMEKAEIWLLTDASEHILGVIPYRQDGRFTANEDSQNVLKVVN